MGMDFSLILIIATVVCGVIWGLHSLIARDATSGKPVLVEYAQSFFPILLIVLVVRSFLFEPFRIPSSSMMPTLLIGDFIFVNKYTYGLRLPVINSKIYPIGEPQRGDVVVFKLPADPSVNYIKRLVGLPGDTVRYQKRRLYVNDEIISLNRVGTYPAEEQPGSVLFSEVLGDVEHQILLTDRGSREGTFVVPQGYYFMMGDNRDNSKDSRFADVGLIADKFIVGKAVRIWMNWDFSGAPRWSRVGTPIQ